MADRRRHEAPPWLAAANPFAWATRTFDSFRPSAVPAMARPSYAHEIRASFFLPWLMAIVEGGVIGVIVKKYFEGVVDPAPLNYAVATLTAAPAFANIASFVWVRLTHGKNKVRSVNVLQLAIALLVALIAAAPRSAAGLVLVVACAVAARVCLAGVVTIRATVWRQNYPREVRARITSRVATVVTIVVAVVSAAIGWLMDQNTLSFRVFIPVASLVALVGIWSWSKIRVRGHRRLIRAERENDGDDRPSFNPLRMARLLIDDRRYGFFMACQFTLGAGNLMLAPILVVVAVDVFEMAYLESIVVAQVIPIVMMPIFLTQWARLLDRWHIATYRAVHSWLFVVMAGLMYASVALHQPWLLYLGVAVRGIAFAGGALAWNLGHNDFARDDNAAQYMAVHVTLTGIRGLLSSFVGVAMYEWFEDIAPGAGAWVFALGGAIVSLGAVGFYVLHREIKAERSAEGGTDSPE